MTDHYEPEESIIPTQLGAHKIVGLWERERPYRDHRASERGSEGETDRQTERQRETKTETAMSFTN